MERLKANLLALLVAAHLLAITLQALPAPGGGMSRSTWKDPTVQAEFDAWRVRLNGWGWDGTTAQLEDQLWDFAKGFMERRDQVLTPFKPYYKHAGTTQAWRMFVAPHRYPARLELDVLEGTTWRLVYKERDAEATWRGRWLDHDRVRSLIFRFSWRPYRKQYEMFVRRLAKEAARDFPQATSFRARFFKYQTLSPEDTRAGKAPSGRYVEVLTVPLGGAP
ncbi:hypothetical protein L6R46_13860 [Myxococcota bacterium]|nr:hypothetical protein [Myxococcota bacterium]